MNPFNDDESATVGDDRPVSTRRYVVGTDDERSQEHAVRRDDPYTGDRELVIRRKAERDDGPLTVQRYEQEVDYDVPNPYERVYYEPRNVYVGPRESDYDVVRRSDIDDYDGRHSRRELSPRDSVSRASRRRDRDQDYDSDDSLVYIRKETRDYDDDHPHHRRYLAEGALVGAGAAELIRSHRKREGEEVSHGLGHLGKTVGARALGTVADNVALHARDYYRSKSRHHSRSFDDDHYSHRRSRRGRHSRSRSRSRSLSHSRAKTLLELGLGAAAVAGAVAASRNNANKEGRSGQSSTRSRSRGRARSTVQSDNGDAQDVDNKRHGNHEHCTKRINEKDALDDKVAAYYAEMQRERAMQGSEYESSEEGSDGSGGNFEKRAPADHGSDVPTQLSVDMDYPRIDIYNNQSTGETSPGYRRDASAVSSMMTGITTPEDQREATIDAGITQPNDLRIILDAARYYEELDELTLETAKISGIDRSLDVQDRHSSLVECCNSISNYIIALRNLQNKGFCRDALVILAQDRFRSTVAKAIHIPLWNMCSLERCLKESDHNNCFLPKDVLLLIREIHGGWTSKKPSSTLEWMPYLNFLCGVLSIGLVSFSGSHVCRFDSDITGQEVEEILVGIGNSYSLRRLSCLSSFIGGAAWVLGKSRPLAQQEELKVSLTVQDLQELWGPVWLLGGSPEEGHQIIRTERGYIVPLRRQEQQNANAEEIECHWTTKRPEYFMSQLGSEDRPLLLPTSRMLLPTSRILVGIDITEPGLTVNKKCQLQISLIQQRMACQLQVPGTTRAHLIDDGYEVNLSGGQYVMAGIVKKWKRMPARTQKTALVELCRKPGTRLLPLLKLRVGLEVSACTGNAQRTTLWDALRLSHKAYAADTHCGHKIGDINCIRSCWNRSNSCDDIDSLIDIAGEQKELSNLDARQLIIHSILALEHTG